MGAPMTASRPPGEAHAYRSRRARVYDAVVLAVALAAVLPVASLLHLPPFVDAVTVSNATVYDVRIEVAGGGTGWTAIGTARRAGASTFERVIDQGEAWVFRFSAQGWHGGMLRVPRSTLEADDWRIAIPEEVGRTLAARDAPRPP